MKVSKEFKIGLAVILSTTLLILGINFLKGSSFFGGDKVYYAYFPTSGSLQPSSAVTLNGVEVGRVLAVDLMRPNEYTDPSKRVLVTYSVQTKDLRIAKGSNVKIVPGVLNTEMQLIQNFIADEGYHNIGDTLQGSVSQELTEQIETQLLPVKRKLEDLMVSIENIVSAITVFWDTSAAYSLDQSLNEVKIAIARFGNVAYNVDELIASERVKLSNIFSNVEDITENFKQTNLEIQKAVGNVSDITDSLLTADLKGVISEATSTLRKLNSALEDASDGQGTLGKLLKDEQLYDELNLTNKRLQYLVDDIQLHPERYIHISVFGRKTKGASLTREEERKLKSILDTIQ